ncbi:MAG: cell division protein FtsA [Pseudomonadota bacterium]
MQLFFRRLNRNLSNRHIIINVTNDDYILATVVQHEPNQASVIILDDKKYNNSGFRDGVISHYENAKKDVVEILYDLSQHALMSKYSSDFLGKTFVDFVIPDKYNVSCLRHQTFLVDAIDITDDYLKSIKDDILQGVMNENPGKIVLYSVVCNWELDGNFIMNPVGLKGNVLKCYMHCILIDSTIQTNFENLLSERNLILNTICPKVCLDVATYVNNFSSRTMLLSVDQRITTLAVIIDNDIVFCDKINIGFQHIVQDVVKVLGVTVKQAISYIAEYGCDDNADIKLDNDKVDVKQLHQVIHARICELMMIIKKQYVGNMMDVERICLLNIKIDGIERCVEQIFDDVEVMSLCQQKYNQRLLLNNVSNNVQEHFFSRLISFIYN